MRKLIMAALCIAAAANARAADLSGGSFKDGPLYDPDLGWAGFHIALLGGVSSNNTKFKGDGPYSGGFTTLEGNYAVSPSGSNTSGIGSIEMGYDWQLGLYVLGLAADLNAVSARHNSGTADYEGPDTDTIIGKVDYFGTIRARAGVTFQNNLLLYGTGGLALSRIKGGYYDSDGGAGEKTSDSAWGLGWAAGAGVDYRFREHWIFRAEYLHVSTSANLSTFSVEEQEVYAVKTFLDQDIGRFGILYKF